jgi:hypothetical protein
VNILLLINVSCFSLLRTERREEGKKRRRNVATRETTLIVIKQKERATEVYCCEISQAVPARPSGKGMLVRS